MGRAWDYGVCGMAWTVGLRLAVYMYYYFIYFYIWVGHGTMGYVAWHGLWGSDWRYICIIILFIFIYGSGMGLWGMWHGMDCGAPTGGIYVLLFYLFLYMGRAWDYGVCGMARTVGLRLAVYMYYYFIYFYIWVGHGTMGYVAWHGLWGSGWRYICIIILFIFI